MQNSRQLRGTLILLAILSRTPQAAETKSPPSTADYTGVTAQNFLKKVSHESNNPFADYVLPKIDVNRALIVDAQGIGGRPSDTNSGTVQQPFKTLARAVREIKPGTTILLRGGVYSLETEIKIDGTAGQKGSLAEPVLISSYPGESAILTATTPLAKWSLLEGTNVYYHDFDKAPAEQLSVWVDDKQIPPIRRYLLNTTADGPFRDKTTKPVEGAIPVTAPGTWAIDGKRLYLRAVNDADPNKLRVETSDTSGINLAQTTGIIFNRLTFRKHSQAVISYTSPHIIFRQCLFDNCSYAITYFGGDAAERGLVDECMFNRMGDGTRGTAIYTTSPMTIRNSFFRDTYPDLAITAYTSKPDMFTGLQVIGNTFIHGGACITSTGKGSVIRNNIALCSRFVSSAGADAVIEDNLAVYDPQDLAEFPQIPRRDVGFRLYGRNARLSRNSFIGYQQGGLVTMPEGADGEAVSVQLDSNAFYEYSDYALRVTGTQNLRSNHNFFAPQKPSTTTVYLTPDQQHKTELTLQQWQAKGFDLQSRLEPGKQPDIPTIIRQALAERKQN